jgi:CubicO group peptidase (beta-lactamase class C family)
MAASLATNPSVRSAIGLLEAWLESQLAYRGWPGLSIGVLHDQELIWARGFGHASLERSERATPDTLYRIASITKLFTSTAILQLRDAGKLRLSDSLTQHLTLFKIGEAYPDAPPITIEHLLTHTAGLPRESVSLLDHERLPSTEDARRRLPEQYTALPTETSWKYSNLGLALAGEVVAAVAGQPFEQYVSERILKPLGMDRTFVKTPPKDAPGLATGYTRRLPTGARTETPFTDGRWITPAANMTTSVTDLARFAMLQLRDGPAGGAQLLRGSTLREMHRPHWVEPDWVAGWGLGFRLMREGGRTLVGHGGRLRGYRTQLQLCPAERIGVIVMINAEDGEPLVVASRAFEWVAPAIVKAVAPSARDGLPPGWERYVGKYRSPGADTQVLVLDGGLALIDPSVLNPTLAITRLRPIAEHTFRMETTEGYASNGELVVFELDSTGHVCRVKIGENYTEPIANW